MLQTTKKCFDVTSISLANFLQVSVDMMNSVLTGRRVLDLAPWERAIKLHQAIKPNVPLKALEHIDHILQIEDEEGQEALEVLIKKLEKDLSRKCEQLDQLRNTRGTLLRGLNACRVLLTTHLDVNERKWILLRKRHLESKLKAYSLYSEWKVEAEILGLEAGLGRLKLRMAPGG